MSLINGISRFPIENGLAPLVIHPIRSINKGQSPDVAIFGSRRNRMVLVFGAVERLSWDRWDLMGRMLVLGARVCFD